MLKGSSENTWPVAVGTSSSALSNKACECNEHIVIITFAWLLSI